jgi:hypothetical protein
VIVNFDRVWMSRLEPHGRALLVGTPWHQADLHHELLRRPAWCVLRQWVSEDLSRIEQEVYNPPLDYPLPAMAGAASRDQRAFEAVIRLGGADAINMLPIPAQQNGRAFASPPAWRLP